MLPVKEIRDKLFRLPEEFARHYAAGEYCRAAFDHEKAVRCSEFVRLDEPERSELLSGFDQEKVIQAYKAAGRWEDVKRAGDTEKAVRPGRHVPELHAAERIPECRPVR